MFKLYNDDCFNVMSQLEDESIDMILCDLPYGTTKNKWDVILPFDKLWEQYERIIKPNGAIVLFADEPFASHLRLSNEELYRYDLIWCKPYGSNPLIANKRPQKAHEYICIFYKHLPVYNPQKTFGHGGFAGRDSGVVRDKNRDYTYNRKVAPNTDGSRLPLSYVKFDKDNRGKKTIHPTQKPIALLEWLIKTYTNEGMTVLDNCMGSGSTGVACVNCDRDFIGIELEKGYFDIASQRIEEAENFGTTLVPMFYDTEV